jgi:hypothetical protein
MADTYGSLPDGATSQIGTLGEGLIGFPTQRVVGCTQHQVDGGVVLSNIPGKIGS